jgi:flagellar motility protein MotE (MotC chaperone)
MMKQLYYGAATVALVNCLALVGLGVFSWKTGRLDRERIEQVAAVLRNEAPVNSVEAEGNIAPDPVAAETQSSGTRISEAIQADEAERLKKDKMLADLQHQQVLIDRQMLRLQQEQERHDRDKSAYESQRRKREDQALSATFTQLVQTIGNMKPRNALNALMRRSDAEAVRVLTELAARKRLGIIDGCKNDDEVLWRDRMFDLMMKSVATRDDAGSSS